MDIFIIILFEKEISVDFITFLKDLCLILVNFSATLSVNVVYRFETFAYPQTWNNSFPGVYILFIVICTWLFFNYKSTLIRGEVDQKRILQTYI